jgi:hypothetical protein
MHLEGMEIINAPREKVWDFITDPQRVSRCAPGVETVEVVAPNQTFRAVATIPLGALKTTFTVTVTYATLAAPELANFRAKATAPGGEVQVTSFVSLAPTPEGGTELRWGADINLFGTIAALGARLIPSLSKTLTADFFACVRTTLSEA